MAGQVSHDWRDSAVRVADAEDVNNAPNGGMADNAAGGQAAEEDVEGTHAALERLKHYYTTATYSRSPTRPFPGSHPRDPEQDRRHWLTHALRQRWRHAGQRS